MYKLAGGFSSYAYIIAVLATRDQSCRLVRQPQEVIEKRMVPVRYIKPPSFAVNLDFKRLREQHKSQEPQQRSAEHQPNGADLVAHQQDRRQNSQGDRYRIKFVAPTRSMKR